MRRIKISPYFQGAKGKRKQATQFIEDRLQFSEEL